MSDTQFWVTVGVWNLIVFSMYGYDKLYYELYDNKFT